MTNDSLDTPALTDVVIDAGVRARLARAVFERFGEGASIAWARDVADDLLADAFLIPLPDQPLSVCEVLTSERIAPLGARQ